MFKLNVQEPEKKGHKTTEGKSGGGRDENTQVVLTQILPETERH